MNRRERDALDRHITGNYGEDQFTDEFNFVEEQATPLTRLLVGVATVLVASGLWWLIIWGAVEGWKHIK
jgi:hypothetical protein